MTKSSVSQSVTDLIEPVVQAEDLELVDVEYKKTGRNWTLKVFIDKVGGVTVGDCQKVSRQIEDLIELEELISSDYVLEVSSPGLDRPLKREKDFLKYKDKKVQVRTFSPVENRRNFSGTIKDFKDQTLILEEGGHMLSFRMDQIAQAKLIIEF